MTEIFEPNRHLREVKSWADQWSTQLNLSILPKTGRIVPGKAAIFLYKTDSSVGFIENLICNREVNKHDVNEAINACVSDIEKDAKAMGINLIICSTNLQSVIDRSKIFGYSSKPNTLLYKELK